MTFNPEQKKGLISRLIKMAESDGRFHDEEYDLIHSIAREYDISSAEVELLFEKPLNNQAPREESGRIVIIYLLYLVMMVDSEISRDELFVLKQTALKLALPAAAIQRFIEHSTLYPNGNIPISEVIKIFQIHHN